MVVLPLVLLYLTPKAVACFGLGAISAAVMSSTDSSMLSASTMMARNFYQKVIRPNCNEKEVIIALYVCIIINCVIAIVYRSIYDLFVLCGDFMFVIVFPQLTLVLYWELANTYGSVVSFFIGLLLRLLCGDKTMGIPAAIEFGKIYAASSPSLSVFFFVCCAGTRRWGFRQQSSLERFTQRHLLLCRSSSSSVVRGQDDGDSGSN